MLGNPLDTDQLQHERLGRPTALAVFASDALSSTAYATEEILRTLIPVVGLLAFSFVLPITLAMTGVLVILMFSYRQTIKAYPSAGGAYIVTKDNLGLLPAQVAGVALLTDYILTVAVSVSAGVAALYSAFGDLRPYRVPIALGFIVDHRLGQPARRAGVGPDVRGADVRVPRQHLRDDRRRRVQGGDRRARARADPRRSRRRSAWPARSASSCCSTPSRPVVRR